MCIRDRDRELLSTQDQDIESHNHTATSTFSGNPLSNHTHEIINYNTGGVNGDSGFVASAAEAINQRTTANTLESSAGTPSGTVSTTVNNSSGTETRPLNISWMFIIFTG